MTTPSGQISLNDVNVELNITGTTTIQMNQANVRTLAGVGGSGTTISMQNLQNKTNRVSINYTFYSHTANASLNLSSIGGYISGKSDITVTINGGVYLYSTSTGNYGLNLSGGTTGDTLTIVNNGFILGQGGNGGSGGSGGASGGPALNLGFGMSACTINNTNGSAYIAGGGGGGGGGGGNTNRGGAGGGAGGGSGGSGDSGGGGGGGGIGSSGSSGSDNGGGGGGRILPGSGGAGSSGYGPGSGGGAGGGGGSTVVVSGKYTTTYTGGAGGGGTSGGSAGSSGYGAGGGGGWGSSGGSGGVGGGSGGKAVNLNGKSLTWTSGDTGRVYGAVS